MTTVQAETCPSATGAMIHAAKHGLRSQPFLELAKQVSLVSLAILLYFAVRGMTQGDVGTAVQNGLDVLHFEQNIGIDIE